MTTKREIQDYYGQPAWQDEQGSWYSADGRRLLRAGGGGSTSLVLQEGLEVLCDRCLMDCGPWKCLTLPSTLREAEPGAWEGWEGCEELVNHSPHFVSDGVGLFTAEGDTLVVCWKKLVERYVVPEGVKRIGREAFGACEELREVLLPQSLEEVGEEAFVWCCELERLTFPEGVKRLGWGVCYGCREMREVQLPEGLEVLPPAAFRFCQELRELHLPRGLRCIAADTCYDCGSLRELRLPDGVERIEEEAFAYCVSMECLHLPASLQWVDEYFAECCERLRALTVPAGRLEHFKTMVPEAWHAMLVERDAQGE